MVDHNEVLALLLSSLVMLLLVLFRRRFKAIPLFILLIAGYFCMYAGMALSVLEGYRWEAALNLGEHACYATSSVLLMIWVCKVFWRGCGSI